MSHDVESSGAPGGSHGLVVFSHGKDSSPQALKIKWMQPLAEAAGWSTQAVDYSDTNDPEVRRDRLVEALREETQPIVLWGSSLGGVVSVFAARQRPIAGLFLLAPAVYWPGHETLDHRVDSPVIELVHGWHDDVVPHELSIRFAQEHRAPLHLLDDDHLLHKQVEQIGELFRRFLDRVAVTLGA